MGKARRTRDAGVDAGERDPAIGPPHHHRCPGAVCRDPKSHDRSIHGLLEATAVPKNKPFISIVCKNALRHC
jgi:hypothetical protein